MRDCSVFIKGPREAQTTKQVKVSGIYPLALVVIIKGGRGPTGTFDLMKL